MDIDPPSQIKEKGLFKAAETGDSSTFKSLPPELFSKALSLQNEDDRSLQRQLNTRETAFALRKLPLIKAKRYLEAIPFRRFCGGVGRTTQAKNRHSNGQGRWPVKSAKFILDLLKNAEKHRKRIDFLTVA